LERARSVAEVAAVHADDVDRAARFPTEAIAAAREAGLLSLLVPAELGGEGVPYAALAQVITTLGTAFSSTGMVLAMHHIQVACLVRHGGTAPAIRELLAELVADQLLFASATTEIGIGGDVRRSTCAIEWQADPSRWRLVKNAPVISYGAHADAVLATARHDEDSPAGDQVLAVCRAAETVLDQQSVWDTMGMRGTCSPGFLLTAQGPAGLVLPVPYADISAQTMLPVSHLLWSALWLGVATAAADKARRFVQAEARKSPGSTPPSAQRLAELMVVHLQLRALVEAAGTDYDERCLLAGGTDGFRFAASANTLKVAATSLVVDVVHRALLVCGIAAYREDTPYRMGRLLRDAHGGAVMVANDRILANTAHLLLADRG
jgi:acyl-CoA dehydrogenase